MNMSHGRQAQGVSSDVCLTHTRGQTKSWLRGENDPAAGDHLSIHLDQVTCQSRYNVAWGYDTANSGCTCLRNFSPLLSSTERKLTRILINMQASELRHIENRLEAAPGTGVLLDSVLDTKKSSVSGRRKIRRRDGHHMEESGSKSRTRSRRSPDKISRSPLRNSTLDNNTMRPSAVEFREPLASYREASPLPMSQTHSDPDALLLPTEMGVSHPDLSLSQLVCQRDTRDMENAELDSTRSSAVDSTSVRYLNDLSALSAIHEPDPPTSLSEVKPRTHLQGETSGASSASSPGSVSQRLENLRRWLPNEQLNEKICRHLEETLNRNNPLGYLDQPVGIGAAGHTTVPTVKVRKVARAPPAPIYKGFNTIETKIRTPNGKVWAEEDFKSFSREIYKDLTQRLTADSTKPKQRPAERERTKEKKPSKPVRKVHRSSSAPDSNSKPAITTSAWRDGQKLVKMMLGPAPRIPSEPRAQSTERQTRRDPVLRSASDTRLERGRRSGPNSTEKPRNHELPMEPAGLSRSAGGARGMSLSTDLLSADIRSILDDLQLGDGSSRTVEPRVRSSTRVSRSTSPAKAAKRAEQLEQPVQKKRHYDAEAVRMYITQKQEERKKRQAEERKAQREEEEKRNQRLQELYRRQRAGAVRGPVAPAGPIKKRLHETYTKLLLEQTQLVEEINAAADAAEAAAVTEINPRLLELDTDPSRPERGSRSAPLAFSSDTGRKMSRIEALKATAASLSSRIESEARKLAGTGINYGCARDMGTGLSLPTDHRWANPVSPPVRENPIDSGDLEKRIQRLLAGGQSTYEDALPGVGNLHNFRKRTTPGDKPPLKADAQEVALDSSGGSISEGPLLSEGSMSEDEDELQELPSSSHRVGNTGYSRVLRNGDPISHFQKEAEKHLPFSPSTLVRESNGPWEELAKGSPHSVINIFTKNMPSYGKTSERSLLEEHRNTFSAVSDIPAEGFNRNGSKKSSSRSSNRSMDTDSTLGGASVHSIHSLSFDGKKSPRSPSMTPAAGSPAGSASSRLSRDDGTPIKGSAQGLSPPHTTLPSSSSSSSSVVRAKANPSSHSPRAEHRTPASAELQFAPGVLQQQLSAELCYLEAVEESVRQLSDVERVRGVSLAQQETVSLAQILKSHQHRHEHELNLLRMKAEQEALETQRQLEESRQRAARVFKKHNSFTLEILMLLKAHAELQESFLQSQQLALGGLHESTNKMIHQQAEATRHTAETARHIKEMTELARSQITGLLSVPGPSLAPLYDQQKQPNHSPKQLQTHPHTDSLTNEPSRDSETETPPDSLSGSIPSRRPTISGGGSSSAQLSPSHSDQKEKKEKDGSSSSVEDLAHTAADESLRSDSIQSLLEEKVDSASIATEYSVKFEDSMTEDEIEEKSFRSLLPSEAHRRESLDRKHSPHPESDDDHRHDRTSPRESSKDGSTPFSSGQGSFSKFTMDLVRQYMKEEEVRAEHQNSLLRLRQKALREKTKAELAWLEHQKRQDIYIVMFIQRLRDKGEDDKMPPLRKRQRGLIMKLQQEQAEIKRLQEANKAARRERQLLLKQQEEIERMRHSTLRLKERLKKSGDASLESPVSGVEEESAPPSVVVTDAETRSPSPMSVSGSETSSIMQKLKKMRIHMDEKFLTKREQQLMQRRKHAEELLEWRQRLDAEEADVRRMEKQALVAWEKQQQARIKTPPQQQPHRLESERSKSSRGQEAGSEDDSPALSVSSVHTDLSVSEQLASLSSDRPLSELPSPHMPSSPAPDNIYSPEFQPTDSKQVRTKLYGSYMINSESEKDQIRACKRKASLSSVRHPDVSQTGTVVSPSGSSSRMQVHTGIKSSDPHITDPHPATPSETISDQSDIESRIRALKDELRKRKTVVYQLKKEQKKRHKERLKAQEASLLKQLESYNDFIQKTKAELSKEPDNTPTTKPQIKTPTSGTEKPRIKPPPLQSPETSKNWKIVTESEKSVHTETSTEKDDVGPSENHTSQHEDFTSDEDPPTVTPTPVVGSPEHINDLTSLHSPDLASHHLEDAPPLIEHSVRTGTSDHLLGDESLVSCQKSDIMEELEYVQSEVSESDISDQHSDILLKLDLESQILKDVDIKTDEEILSGKDVKPAFQVVVDVGESSRCEMDNNASPAEESKDLDFPLAEKSPSVMDPSNTPEFMLSKKEDSPNIKETSSPGDGYIDDFESSFESFKEDIHESKPASPSSPEPKKWSYKSPTYSTEEEIEEELSIRSGSTNESFQAESQADLNRPGEVSKEDVYRSSKCPTSPQEPTLPINDELPSFCVGDRVLVSNVQPGTLRFKGQTNFANGFWAGVELDNPEGSNKGTYDGVVYFECRENHGIFAPPDKISRLPEKFEASADTEDEDSSFDDQLNTKPNSSEKKEVYRNFQNMKGQTSDLELHPKSKEPSGEVDNKQHNLDSNDINCNIEDFHNRSHAVPNGRGIILEFGEESVDDDVPFLNYLDKGLSKKQKQENEQTAVILDLLEEDEKSRVDGLPKSTDISIEEASIDMREDLNNKRSLTTLADKLVENFLSDAVKQFQKIKKDKEEKLSAANQLKKDFINEDDGLRSSNFKSQNRSNTRTDNFRTFFDEDQEELSSPEHSNRPESPFLGTSGQEELAKRLTELELSRELFDSLGDDQDWFDEDFGLSSRKQQQQKQKQQKDGISTSLSSGEQPKTPPRPELPLQMKQPEEPAMIVPHTVQDVQKLAGAATLEIWKNCKLGNGRPSLAGVPKPQPSNNYLGEDAKANDQESQCKQSYKLAVFDLSWEVIKDIYAEDPKVDQPQWMKPHRLNSNYFHRVKCPNDITTVQEFVTAEVLKLCGLRKEQNQKTDWQKMIKFGRKKRDRVDHILVQELHEEESQWVNYDEDELFVKMQLADGIFDALLKDTTDVLTQIQENRSKRTL
ncbi:Centrosome-associated protein 350 [Triplophysa tibetana]|uniref:Centrosome-associated protein 350 n=1 Tax=Triplophysa tibetana TaxID=1572043 RepID=A0A5A9NWK2_9TELE|nr:Centrosome-associated protein 350 [Triplophysa tibetana]